MAQLSEDLIMLSRRSVEQAHQWLLRPCYSVDNGNSHLESCESYFGCCSCADLPRSPMHKWAMYDIAVRPIE